MELLGTHSGLLGAHSEHLGAHLELLRAHSELLQVGGPIRSFRGSLGQMDRRTDPLMYEAMGGRTYPFREIYEAHLRMIVFQ